MSPANRLSMLLLAVFVICGLCQGTPSTGLESYPSCALPCLQEALVSGPCSLTDQTCMCTDEAFLRTVEGCVSQSCTIPESLAVKNASATTCNAPVRDRSGQLVAVSDAMAVIASVFIIIRFVYKGFVIKLGLGLDDWLILATMVAAVPSAFITVYGTTPNGLGKDIWTLTPESITNVLIYFYTMAILYFLQTTLVKLSIIAFYMRIFPGRETQRLLWGTFIFTTLWGLAFILAAIFQCHPINAFWTTWDGLHKGSCVDANALAWSNAAMNIALDLWVLAIPMWELRRLQLHWKKKVGVGLMFCVGTFVTVMSILRLQSLVVFAKTTNRTWEFFDVSMWSTIEISVGIICACLPTVRLLLVKLFPVLSGSTHRMTGSKYYRRYASQGRSGGGSHNRGNTSHIVSVDRRESVPSTDENSGIVFQKSYAVQYSENDEIGLVSMTNSNEFGRERT